MCRAGSPRGTFGIPCGTGDGTGGDAGGDAQVVRHTPVTGAGCCEALPGKERGGPRSLWGVLSLWPLARGFIMGF